MCFTVLGEIPVYLWRIILVDAQIVTASVTVATGYMISLTTGQTWNLTFIIEYWTPPKYIVYA